MAASYNNSNGDRWVAKFDNGSLTLTSHAHYDVMTEKGYILGRDGDGGLYHHNGTTHVPQRDNRGYGAALVKLVGRSDYELYKEAQEALPSEGPQFITAAMWNDLSALEFRDWCLEVQGAVTNGVHAGVESLVSTYQKVFKDATGIEVSQEDSLYALAEILIDTARDLN